MPADEDATCGRRTGAIQGQVNTDELISLKEAAARFPISQSHLELLARTGRLKATKLGRDWFTTAEAVAAYLGDAKLRSKDPYKHKRG